MRLERIRPHTPICLSTEVFLDVLTARTKAKAVRHCRTNLKSKLIGGFNKVVGTCAFGVEGREGQRTDHISPAVRIL